MTTALPLHHQDTRSEQAYQEKEAHFDLPQWKRYIAFDGSPVMSGQLEHLFAFVPMCENQPQSVPAVRGMAEYLSEHILPGNFWVMSGGASFENEEAVRQGGGIVLRQDDVFEAVNWQQLLDILNLRNVPRGRSGKGFNVFASHLFLAARGAGQDAVVFQSDSEISDYRHYNPLGQLWCAWQQVPGIRHAKMAKYGRNNETAKSAVSMLQGIFECPLPQTTETEKQFAYDVYHGIAPDKWMCTGEWLSHIDVVLHRPLATGYLEETLQALWCVHADQCGWQRVRYVENPRPRSDSLNSHQKEEIMMSTISRFIFEIVRRGIPPCTWTLDHIARLNRELMPKMNKVPLVGDQDGPVIVAENCKPDRIIPPVALLVKEGIVNLKAIA